jgi:diguanylate cyclase (GGDEF)-like protein
MTSDRAARAISMFEQLKIGIVYKDRVPQFLLENVPEGTPWKFEFFQYNAILTAPFAPFRDYLAVFFAFENETAEIQRHLSNLFPGAQIVGFQNPEKPVAGSLARNDAGLLIVQFPMPFHLAFHLLEEFSQNRKHKRELATVQRRSDNIQDFFEAFVSTIDASSDVADRKAGLSRLIDKILAHIQAEECIVYLFGEGSATLQRAYCTGNIQDFDLFERNANSSIVQKVLNSGAPYLNNHYSFELKVPFSKDSVFIRSIVCYPLQRRGEKIGAIELVNKISGTFTKEDLALLEIILDPLTTAIRTLDTFERAERLTITDDLTKLYNYRYLMQYLEADVRRCLRYKKKVSLLFIDVDGFKRINDTFGHLVGSQALSEMGQVFRGIVRETDVVGRYGGDEFVIVLPETPLNGAMIIAERIRKKVEEFEFVAQNLSIRLTVSLGVASCPKHTLTAEGLIKKADAAMYRAKELSKNSIKVAV